MINVRVQIWRDAKEFWSSAIRDPQALESLKYTLAKCGLRHAVWDDFGRANVADGCLAIAERVGGIIEYTWGPGHRYCCRLAPVPRAEGKLSWDGGECVTPRDLAGPLPEEVAGHTPCACCEADYQITITPFDVHGAPCRSAPPPAAATVTTIQPLLRRPTLLERIIQLIVGCEQGEAVRGP